LTELIIDIETNGLDPDTIWCCGVKVVGSPEGELMMTAEELQCFLDKHKGATVYAHNGRRYDYPILERLWGIDFDHVNLRDSVILSREANPRRIGGHSLKAWGQALGFPKGVYSDWTKFTPAMGTYCVQDLNVTEKLLEVVKEELKQPSAILETKVKEIINEQIEAGWLLDMPKCFDLLATLRERKDEVEANVHQRFKPLAVPTKVVVPKVKSDGSYSRVGLNGFNFDSVSGSFTKVGFPEFNLGSRKQIGAYLVRFGWKPKAYTATGQPVVDEGALEGSTIPEAQLIAEYLMLEKRIAMAASWIEAADDEGRVHGHVDPCGAVTGRMTHSKPNLGQVTAPGKPYGKEMRQCWTVPEGYKLVGCDADALELRMLAHYMADDAYIKTVDKGSKDDATDVHSVNQRAAGISTRDRAKTFIYAFLYGAGDAKIGSILGQGRSAGTAAKKRFMDSLPSLRSLRNRVEKAAERGYLKGLDKRHIEVRSPHAALNTLLQGAGAVYMKQVMVMYYEKATKEGLDFTQVSVVHDEINVQVKEEQAPRLAEIMEEAFKDAGEHFNLRCPTKGNAITGDTWYDVH